MYKSLSLSMLTSNQAGPHFKHKQVIWTGAPGNRQTVPWNSIATSLSFIERPIVDVCIRMGEATLALSAHCVPDVILNSADFEMMYHACCSQKTAETPGPIPHLASRILLQALSLKDHS